MGKGTPAKSARVAGALAAALALAAPDGRASTVRAMSLAELTARADRIVVAQVTAVRASWDRARRRIYTTVDVRVEDSWKGGQAPGAHIAIVQPGGVVDDVEMRVHGFPSFAAGERAVIFLSSGAEAAVVGMTQGKRTLKLDRATRAWLVEGADPSAVVELVAGGGTRPVARDPIVPLAELRHRVLTLVGSGSGPRAPARIEGPGATK